MFLSGNKNYGILVDIMGQVTSVSDVTDIFVTREGMANDTTLKRAFQAV